MLTMHKLGMVSQELHDRRLQELTERDALSSDKEDPGGGSFNPLSKFNGPLSRRGSTTPTSQGYLR